MAHLRRSKAGTLADLQRALWLMIRRVEALAADDPPPDRVLWAGHCLAQLANSYKAVVETASIDERLAALERAAANDRHGP